MGIQRQIIYSLIELNVPTEVQVLQKTLKREDFYGYLWAVFGERGLSGIHEGTVLDSSPENDESKIDSAEAPRKRDWVSEQNIERAALYFKNHKTAQFAVKELGKISNLNLELKKIPEQDWNAEWRTYFKPISIPPFWEISPPWEKKRNRVGIPLLINPGAGFGTGTHETTQLCLRILGNISKEKNGGLNGARVLDFGCGSGILAIGSAKLGAQVDAVEIDILALENANENAKLNKVQKNICFSKKLQPSSKKYNFIFANILKPVLLKYSKSLVNRLSSNGTLILSGLLEKDLEVILDAYGLLLDVKRN